jgi:CheY-like chemotaxis protein
MTIEPKKILLVDDSRIVLRVEQMILSRGPYQLILAKDGKEEIGRAHV